LIAAAYIAAAALANLSAAHFGPASLPVNALLLVGLDLSARDALHERWRHDGLWLRMAALVCAGSAVSALLSSASWRVSLASALAFAVSGAVDAIAYQVLGDREVSIRANGSNLASAAVDSILFPLLAFGAVMPGTSTLQFVAKVLGGAAWVLVLRRAGALR
jgi:uncharacterized PurR-regulated membrane protein YhhQ (DUF165 family)